MYYYILHYDINLESLFKPLLYTQTHIANNSKLVIVSSKHLTQSFWVGFGLVGGRGMVLSEC